MKPLTQRLLAAILLVIPGIVATYGFLVMKNAWFDQFEPDAGFPWFKFVMGLALFTAGASFIAGWIYYRDKKRGYVVTRRKTPPKSPPSRT